MTKPTNITDSPDWDGRFPFELRDGFTTDDRGFIASMWAWSDSKSKIALDTGKAYQFEQRRLIDRILASRDTRVVMAHIPGEETALLGFAVVRKANDLLNVYYVFVRHEARRQGIACAMLSRALTIPMEDLSCRVVQYSHKCMIKGIRAPKAWVYNPFRNLDPDIPAVSLRRM